MSELPDDAIGVYHHIFDFSGVRIPFSSFLLALIKHYKVHFSQLGPLGLNKVVTFEGYPDYMSSRHSNSAINDLKPPAGSFNMDDVRRLSTYVVKLRDMPEGVLVLFGLSRFWKSWTYDPVLRGTDGNVMGIYDFFCLPEWTGVEVQKEPHYDIRPTLLRLPFYCTPPAAVDATVLDPTPKYLTLGNPSTKVVVKGEASQKRKASTSGATSSHVVKRTSDDDACVEIPLVTLIRSIAMIPSSGNQSGGSAAPAAEGPRAQYSQGKGIMTDVAATSSVGVSRPRPLPGPTSSFRDISRDAIHMDFFPFSPGLYYATYPEGSVAENYKFSREEWDDPHQPTLTIMTKEVFKDPSVCKTVVDQFLTPEKMVQIEALSSDQLTAKMSSHHEYVQSTNSRLKGYQEKFASLTGQGKERKKMIKSLTKSLDNLHSEVAHLSADLNRATVPEAERDEEILRLKATPLEFASFFQGVSVGFERGLSMHQTKEEFAAVLEKISHFVPGAQGVDMVDGPSHEMTDSATDANPRSVFMQGASHVVDNDAELTLIGSERVSAGPSDVDVALSVGGKGDGSLPSSTVDEEGRGAWYAIEHLLLQAWGKLTVDIWLSIQRILSHATRLKLNGFPRGTFSIVGQASVGLMGPISLPGAKIVLSCLAFKLA
ncbi:hypothetical protein Tco_0434851 [Tanacetum coccineum]